MKTCLCIDDTPESRFIMGFFLKDLGYRTTFAKDGYEAIEKLRESCFDIVVLDIRMPGLSGNAVASYIRTHADHSDTSVISMTASTDQESLARIIRSGADKVLIKPIEYDCLETTVDSLQGEVGTDQCHSQAIM